MVKGEDIAYALMAYACVVVSLVGLFMGVIDALTR